MIKFVVSAAIAATVFATPAFAQGWTPLPAKSAMTSANAPSAAWFYKSGSGVYVVSAHERAAQSAWWAKRADRLMMAKANRTMPTSNS